MNGQSTDTDNIGHTRKRTNTNKKQKKTQHRKLNDEQHGPCRQSGGKARCSRMVSSSWFL